MRNTWYEWEIQWAYEGIVDLATYVGYPKEKVLTSSKDDINDLSLAPPEEKNWVNTVASVKFSQNELLLFPLCGGIDVYLSYGPDLINKIDKSYGYKSISLDEWSKDFPVGGFHIDITSKRLEFWHANVIPDISQELQSKWSDWEVLENYSNYETQYKSTDGLLKFQDINQHQLLEELKILLLKESSNPLDALEYIVKKEADAGRKVEISPYALRYDRYELPKNLREEILDYATNNYKSHENMEYQTMKMMCCWRCKCEMPMLDEREYARIQKLYGDCMKATKEFRQEHGLPLEQLSMDERFSPVIKEYEKITGVSGVHHNAIMHHQISLFGDPCQYCGKPLRTPNAKLCASCGQPK